MLVKAWIIAQKSAPSFEENVPLTFSQIKTRGLHSVMSLIASQIRELRVPLVAPARFPAILKSWQGDPKVIMSTLGRFADRIDLTSPNSSLSL